MKTLFLVNALQFMKSKHEGQTRIGGDEYYTHPLRVAEILQEKGFDVYVQVTGLFHDLLEDTDATDDEIKFYSGEFGKSVLEAVKLLTKTKGYEMSKYIADISNNKMAKLVKLADRLHNLQCAKVASDKFKNKYIKETEEWYLKLAKDTVFEKDIEDALQELKESL